MSLIIGVFGSTTEEHVPWLGIKAAPLEASLEAHIKAVSAPLAIGFLFTMTPRY